MPVRVVTSHVEEQVRDTFHLPLLSCTYLHLPVATCVGCACLHEMKFKQIIQWHSLTDACPAAATTRLKVKQTLDQNIVGSNGNFRFNGSVIP